MSFMHHAGLTIPLDLAETLVSQLQIAARETGRETLLTAAWRLQAEIDTQYSQAPPEH